MRFLSQHRGANPSLVSIPLPWFRIKRVWLTTGGAPGIDAVVCGGHAGWQAIPAGHADFTTANARLYPQLTLAATFACDGPSSVNGKW
jgi:hypothetical protein